MTDANVCTANLEILVHVHMHTNHFYIEVEISRFCQETKKQLRKHTHTHTHPSRHVTDHGVETICSAPDENGFQSPGSQGSSLI